MSCFSSVTLLCRGIALCKWFIHPAATNVIIRLPFSVYFLFHGGFCLEAKFQCVEFMVILFWTNEVLVTFFVLCEGPSILLLAFGFG